VRGGRYYGGLSAGPRREMERGKDGIGEAKSCVNQFAFVVRKTLTTWPTLPL
jgi:hypothetical protein